MLAPVMDAPAGTALRSKSTAERYTCDASVPVYRRPPKVAPVHVEHLLSNVASAASVGIVNVGSTYTGKRRAGSLSQLDSTLKITSNPHAAGFTLICACG